MIAVSDSASDSDFDSQDESDIGISDSEDERNIGIPDAEELPREFNS